MTGRVMTGTMLEGNCRCRSLSITSVIIQYNYLFTVVSNGLCHYSACHSPDFIMRKKKVPVTKIQTEKLQSLNFWTFHENCINAWVSLAPLSFLSAKLWQWRKHCQSLRSREVRILVAISIFMSQAMLLNHKTSVFTTMAPHLHNLLSHWHLQKLNLSSH